MSGLSGPLEVLVYEVLKIMKVKKILFENIFRSCDGRKTKTSYGIQNV